MTKIIDFPKRKSPQRLYDIVKTEIIKDSFAEEVVQAELKHQFVLAVGKMAFVIVVYVTFIATIWAGVRVSSVQGVFSLILATSIIVVMLSALANGYAITQTRKRITKLL